MPHVFNEQFTVWLTRKTADGKKEPIWGAGESNRFSADKVAKKLKELPEFKSDIYEIPYVSIYLQYSVEVLFYTEFLNLYNLNNSKILDKI